MLIVMYRKNRLAQAFGLALVTEILILAMLWLGVSSFRKLHQNEALKSVIIQLNDSPGEQKAKPVPYEVKMAHQATPRASRFVSKPMMPQTEAHTATEQAASSEVPKTAAISSGASADGFSLGPMASTTHFSGKEDHLMEYAAQVKTAVQEVVEYPVTANHMRIKSRVRVEFSLLDGVQQNPRIIKGCGLGVFDHAAIHAVEIAHYPLPPRGLAGQTKLFQVWVEFNP